MSSSRRLLPSTSALAAFEAVARLGSFTRAAAELDLTQGAISRQVLALEAQLGRPLFLRDGRRVALTPEGAEYAEEIRAALRQIRSASLGLVANVRGGILNLAILPTFGTRWLMPRLPEFLEANPGITVNFATRIGRFDFAGTGLDAAIQIGQPDWPGADSTFLMTEDMVPVCAPGHREAHGLSGPEDFARATLLHMASRPTAWERWFRDRGLQPPAEGGMQFEQFAMVTQACMAGLGIALLPEFLIGQELRTGALERMTPEGFRNRDAYYYVTPRARSTYAPARIFRDWLVDACNASAG
ncbi:LysR family transcriptional regulator [Oceanicella sp. SM1341]|uniref:LysR family transcriptional regulator n=1 Tax=Oceanicella sp. SM1341 TaxID=1548889 RepID=UPI000E4CA53B|nr:LysR family transcriptional regulator [Oceanicella sp. SM1341]